MKRKFISVKMAAVSKGYGVGDTVYVHYKDSSALRFLPQSRVVASVDVIDGTNIANVKFTNGDSIQDGASTAQRVFTTQPLCAKAIIDAVITDYTACVLLDTTTSGASTAGATATTLIRKN